MDDGPEKNLDASNEPAADGLPMECRRAGVLIEKSLAGVATETELKELKAHLDACGDCREYGTDAESLSAMFRGIRLRYPDVPQPVVRKRRGRLIRFLPISLAAAASLLLAAGLCFYSFRPGAGNGENEQEEPVAKVGTPDSIAERLGVAIAVKRRDFDPLKPEMGGRVDGRVASMRTLGLLIVEVAPGSWADDAILKPGDRILEANGVVLQGNEGRRALSYMLKSLAPDSVMPLRIYRDGRTFTVEYRQPGND